MAKKGAGKKGKRLHAPKQAASMREELRLAPLQIRLDEPLRLSHDVTPMRQEIRLDPLHIRFDKPFHLTQEAAPIRRRARVRASKVAGVTAPTSQTVKEPAAVEELHRVEFHGLSLQEEVEALETPREAVVEAETSLGAGQEVLLSEGLMQGPRFSWKRIFTKFGIVGSWSNKSFFLASMVLISVALVGSISVVGLLQSAEKIGTSGIVIRPAPPPPPPPAPPPPPEPTIAVDVYSDSSCTTAISNIDWGSVEAGGSARETVYVKNSGDISITLSLATENWNPAGAADYMGLSWDYDGSTLGSGSVVGVTLTLTVDSSITGIENFSFDIVIIGSAS